MRYRVWDGKNMNYPGDTNVYVLDQSGRVCEEIAQLHICDCGERRTFTKVVSLVETIAMFSTGLKDVNEREIYEGDIVVIRRNIDGRHFPYPEKECTAVVRIEEPCLQVVLLATKKLNSLHVVDEVKREILGTTYIPFELEVVGNVCENPELWSVEGGDGIGQDSEG